MCGKAIKRLKRKNSLKDGGEVAGRMQNAKHVHALPGASVEDEIALKASDRQHTHALQIRALKHPGTAHAWQRGKLRTRVFQGWQKARCCLGIVSPDVLDNLKRILPGLW